MKKFELTDETKIASGRTLHRIKAKTSFSDVKAGDLGGYIEKEANLSHDGNAWVYGNARVYGNADYICVKGLGSFYRSTTFFRTKNGIGVKCGCFSGNLKEFVDKVKKTHGNNKFAREYLACVEVVKIHFGLEEDQ